MILYKIKNKRKYLLIGPCENKIKNSPTGGIIVLFSNLINWLSKNKFQIEIIDTNKKNYSYRIIALAYIYLKLVYKIPLVKSVSLHGTANDFIFIAPVTVLYAKLFKKKVTLRKFAGNFEEIYNKLSGVKRLLVNYSLKNADALFFETHHLVEFGKRYNLNCFWLPNVRLKPDHKMLLSKKHTFDHSYVFISHVSKEKGILDLVTVIKELGYPYKLSIYGPLMDIDLKLLEAPNISYKGILMNDKVLSKLIEHDCLILPSYREGYPGIIIEAMSVGISIIATNIGGIPEIILNNKEGLLFDPGNLVQLKNILLVLNAELCNKFSKNCMKKNQEFESGLVYPKIINELI